MTTTDIKLRMGTGQAKQRLRELGRTKERTKKKRRPISRHFGAIAGAVGGLSAVSRVTRSHGGDVDPWSAAMRPFNAAFQQFVDETLGFSSIAKRRAREQTANDLANIPTAGKIEQARRNKDAILPFLEAEESGRNILRQDPRFAGPTIPDLIKQAIPGYFRLIGLSVDYMIEELTQ